MRKGGSLRERVRERERVRRGMRKSGHEAESVIAVKSCNSVSLNANLIWRKAEPV